jgi:hypothetical protein
MNDAAMGNVDGCTVADLDEDGFIASCASGMREEEAKWRLAGKVLSWIDPEPVWVSAADWHWGTEAEYWYGATESGARFPFDPTEPCNRILRFSLIGGGQIKVNEEWRFYRFPPMEDRLHTDRVRLSVKAHTEDGLVSTTGLIDWLSYEMTAKAVVFGGNTSQVIADRVAATLRAIDTDPNNFHALLDGSTGCAICRRALRDEVSKLVAVGPDCARRFNVPHNVAAANRRLERRRALLGLAT